MEYGLIGETLSHSYSKPIHARLGAYDYDIVNLRPDALKEFFARREFKGINVTIPYKKAVMEYCDKISPVAERLGSVNTIIKGEDGRLFGDNTDYYGLRYMAAHAGLSLCGRKVLVLGSGGTGRTAQAVADDAGASEVIVVSRGGPVNYRNVYDIRCVEVIINATPVGMYPNTGQTPVELSRFSDCVGVLDVTYNPLYSRLLLEAKRLKIPFANGLTMLVAQAKQASDMFLSALSSEERIDRIVRAMTKESLNIVLIGMPGSGKSTLACLLAEKTGKRRTDTDEVVERALGRDIPSVFISEGEAFFREEEIKAAQSVGIEKGQVIATGGGVVERHENYLNLKQNGWIVFVDRDPMMLETGGRPLSSSARAVHEMYERRLPLYREFADVTVPNNASPEDAVAQILEVYNETFGN